MLLCPETIGPLGAPWLWTNEGCEAMSFSEGSPPRKIWLGRSLQQILWPSAWSDAFTCHPFWIYIRINLCNETPGVAVPNWSKKVGCKRDFNMRNWQQRMFFFCLWNCQSHPLPTVKQCKLRQKVVACDGGTPPSPRSFLTTSFLRHGLQAEQIRIAHQGPSHGVFLRLFDSRLSSSRDIPISILEM